jgi:hypothetical protein
MQRRELTTAGASAAPSIVAFDYYRLCGDACRPPTGI